MKESEDLLDHARDLVIDIVAHCNANGLSDWSTLKKLHPKGNFKLPLRYDAEKPNDSADHHRGIIEGISLW